MEQRPEDVIVLLDENGGEIEFEILDVVPHGGKEYAVLLPVDDASGEAVILELLPTENEDDAEQLCGVEDPTVLDAVFQLFLERAKAEAEEE